MPEVALQKTSVSLYPRREFAWINDLQLSDNKRFVAQLTKLKGSECAGRAAEYLVASLSDLVEHSKSFEKQDNTDNGRDYDRCTALEALDRAHSCFIILFNIMLGCKTHDEYLQDIEKDSEDRKLGRELQSEAFNSPLDQFIALIDTYGFRKKNVRGPSAVHAAYEIGRYVCSNVNRIADGESPLPFGASDDGEFFKGRPSAYRSFDAIMAWSRSTLSKFPWYSLRNHIILELAVVMRGDSGHPLIPRDPTNESKRETLFRRDGKPKEACRTIIKSLLESPNKPCESNQQLAKICDLSYTHTRKFTGLLRKQEFMITNSAGRFEATEAGRRLLSM